MHAMANYMCLPKFILKQYVQSLYVYVMLQKYNVSDVLRCVVLCCV